MATIINKMQAQVYICEATKVTPEAFNEAIKQRESFKQPIATPEASNEAKKQREAFKPENKHA